jgi:hypothetical protein
MAEARAAAAVAWILQVKDLSGQARVEAKAFEA